MLKYVGYSLAALLLLFLVIGAGQIDVDASVVPSTTHPEHVPVAATVDHGAYLYRAACQHCHRAGLEGGPHPDPKGLAVPGLRKAAGWPYADFKRAMTEGISVDSDSLDDRWMPWSAFDHMEEKEVRALYRYLQARTTGADENS